MRATHGPFASLGRAHFRATLGTRLLGLTHPGRRLAPPLRRHPELPARGIDVEPATPSHRGLDALVAKAAREGLRPTFEA